jgi:hypothetical protein
MFQTKQYATAAALIFATAALGGCAYDPVSGYGYAAPQPAYGYPAYGYSGQGYYHQPYEAQPYGYAGFSPFFGEGDGDEEDDDD